ncbi:P-loop containing nucleoside triphosphate hydrolase protein [Serendipita vermifera]|nr:P-loop containing nucleoside triphosphate hydrolase protein [Serendipita vermifera]
MPICRYFNTPQGCRRSNCTFLHQLGNPDGQAPAKTKPTQTTPKVELKAPHGTCRYFFNYGHCKLDNCKFRHVEPANMPSFGGMSGSGPQSYPAFSRRFGGTANDLSVSSSKLAPTEVIQHITAFCAPRVPFTKPFQMNRFANLLAGVGIAENGWDTKDAQILLELVTEDHGLHNIETIIKFSSVHAGLGSDRNAIPFSTYISCLSYFVSTPVLDTTQQQRVNALYGIIYNNYDQFHSNIWNCMRSIMSRQSFEDSQIKHMSGYSTFFILTLILIELITRYKRSVRENASLLTLVQGLTEWVTVWKTGGFVDSWDPDEHTRKVGLADLDRQVGRLNNIIQRETSSITRRGKDSDGSVRESAADIRRHQMNLIGPLEIHYEPAGQLRESGPRNDNDFADISLISIPPTQEEMMCTISPFLPANIPGAPHHLDSDSMERLLDIQYRLLREELIAPLRVAIQAMIADLRSPSRKTMLDTILGNNGGKYNAAINQVDSSLVNVYASVSPRGITIDKKRGVCIDIDFHTPPGAARNRSSVKRADYWRAVSRKRLMQGGLIGVVWKTQQDIQLYFGLISSSADDIQQAARHDESSLSLRVSFFDPLINLRVLQWLETDSRGRKASTIFMVEAPVMYESIRPFLQALTREPTSFPFSRYLVHRHIQRQNEVIGIEPPRYTTVLPNFNWNLSCLFDGDPTNLYLNPHDQVSVEFAREQLRTHSRLDKSQADAMVDCLTREFSLIQGPPGTGKSFTGVEIMRVLLANHVGRILLIAFTNHALDHLLRSVLKAGITSKIVRLGSRSSDEQISQYSIENLERNSPTNTVSRTSLNKAFKTMKNNEEQLMRILKELQGEHVSEEDREAYMEIHQPEHQDELCHPPLWIQLLKEREQGWTRANRGGSGPGPGPSSLYAYWASGEDIRWIEARRNQREEWVNGVMNRFSGLQLEEIQEDDQDDDSQPDSNLSDAERSTTESDSSEDEETNAFKQFMRLSGLHQLPDIPSSDRPLIDLLADPLVWSMSMVERERLAKSWMDSTRRYFFQRKRQSFSDLKEKYELAKQEYDDCYAQARKQILEKVDIIGCTTNGAAKLTHLLKGVKPTILLVEEAGQVLEAHILGSLVESIQHVIMIGDPLQLRPTISNYSLSMDHPRGKEIYKFDQSTMERLDAAGMAMSKLSVQRRMRPQIASIARETLYPYLEDNECVTQYPHVRGMGKDVFFFHHTHREGGNEEDSMSKYNIFEVDMIKGLVNHLLRQGVYTHKGSIVVLCMYLGQLAKIRAELQASRITVILDARDEEELRNQEGDGEQSENDAPVEVMDARVTDQVFLRTVDNFQGEEADIIILSLVRNPGENKSGTIGFLKSPNRANVALTRARHGLYVFGHADLLAQKSKMWEKVIEQFKEHDSFGSALPIACHRHPEDTHWIDSVERLRQISPDGGCLRPCDYRLKCGHTCPSKCHADDIEHRLAKCYGPCRRTCSRGHPCRRLCWEDCGNCQFPLVELTLDCGHVLLNAPCYLQEDQNLYRCHEPVKRSLSGCEHVAEMPCFQDPSTFICRERCAQAMDCCQKVCNSACSDCQAVSTAPGRRDAHKVHICGRTLHCQHECREACSVEHKGICGTVDCKAPCRQSCSHHPCNLGCSEPCRPCAMPCLWKCDHHQCSVPCGSVRVCNLYAYSVSYFLQPCVRPPCDSRCLNTLRCGHPCPSLCGEPCEQQLCPICTSEEEKSRVVDVILGLTLADLDTNSPDLDNVTITLACRHTFTVETLDGICELNKAYEWDEQTRTWGRLLLPKEVFVKTPTCPTCRSPINARRYGRVTKRGNLDLLERNVATRMARNLEQLHRSFRAVDWPSLEERVSNIANPRGSFDITNERAQAMKRNRRKILDLNNASTAVPTAFLGLHLVKTFGIPKQDAAAWRKVINPILRTCQSAEQLSCQRTAHSAAYQSSLSMLFEQEYMSATYGPRPPRHPQVYAMQVAKTKIGMAPPRADTRFQVESIWLTIDARFRIGTLAEKFYSKLSEAKEVIPAHLETWKTLVEFIYKSCDRDARLALQIAHRSVAHRQVLLSNLRIFKARWRSLQSLVIFKQMQQKGLNPEERKELANKVGDYLLVTKQEVNQARSANINLSPAVVRNEFEEPLSEILKQWEGLLSTLNRPSVFHQPVTEEEKRAVVASFTAEYTHRGHWYTCANGHIFTIADCGGAVVVSRCNECGEPIGGTGHRTLNGVRQAADLERIAGEHGAQASPWRWNENV